MECKHCKNIFNSKYVLENHQKKAKYCLDIQKITVKEIDNNLSECKYCHKTMASNNLNRHINTCKSKDKFLLDEHKQQLEDLKLKNEELKEDIQRLHTEVAVLEVYKKFFLRAQDCVEEIAKQPKTTNNIINMPSLDLSEEKITNKVIENFTESHLFLGQRGVAKFAVENLLKNEDGAMAYKCTDISRNMFKYKDTDGKEYKDPKARKLTKKISAKVIDKAKNITDLIAERHNSNPSIETNVEMKIATNGMSDIKWIEDNNDKFTRELKILTS